MNIRKKMFSIEFLEHLVRHFNGVIREELIFVSSNKIEIKFDRYIQSNRTVVVTLFTKLVEAFKIIKDRYIPNQDVYTQVKIELEDDPDHYLIKITGIIYIPPGKILNLFSLILWYYIRYQTGKKPSFSEKGKKITNEWKKEETLVRYEINKSERKLAVSISPSPCSLCGKEAFALNVWKFKSSNSRTITMETAVCNKHRNKLI